MIYGVPELEDLGDLAGKSVLVRVDFNVPLKDGEVADDLRLVSALPTLRYLLDAGASVTACSHLGRPKGAAVPKYSLDPVRQYLDERIQGVTLLENLRFDPREEANSDDFVKELIVGHDVYVNDAFGASHRAHASIVGPPKFLPSAAGRLLADEIKVLLGIRDSPKRPLVAVMGGAKISDKLRVVEELLGFVDALLIGGGMSYTFLKAQGYEIGASLLEESMVETCGQLLERFESIHLPVDSTALSPDGELFKPDIGEVRQVGLNIQDGWIGADIGPGTAAAFEEVILDAGTVLWNGPMGVFEDPRFAAGTTTIANSLAEASAYTIVGGGDSAAAVRQFGLDSKMDHISTGGGASLELLEQGDLVGIEALRNAHNPD